MTCEPWHPITNRQCCSDCKQKWGLSYCLTCSVAWKHCQICCANISKGYHSYYEDHLVLVDICKIQHAEWKLSIAQDWMKRSVGIVSMFLNLRRNGSFPVAITNMLITFISPRDGYALTRAVLQPLFNGFYIEHLSLWGEPLFNTIINPFFQIQYQDLKSQMGQLLLLNKLYLFSLFELKNFRLVFPKLVSKMSEKWKQKIKTLLPLEFLEQITMEYEVKYKKCADTSAQLFDIFLMLMKLQLKIKNRQLLLEWKKSKQDLKRDDIKDFVSSQKTMFIMTLNSKRQEYEVMQTQKQNQRESQSRANDLRDEQEYTRRRMARLGKFMTLF